MTAAHRDDCPKCAALRDDHPGTLEDIAATFGDTRKNMRRHALRYSIDLTRFDPPPAADCLICVELAHWADYACGTLPDLAHRLGTDVPNLRIHARRHSVLIPAHLERVPA